MATPIKEIERGLTLKDRIDCGYLLTNGILTVQKTLLNVENSETAIRESIEGLLHLIPSNWRDETFNQEFEKLKIEKLVDIRPLFCGAPASFEWCQAHGVQAYRKEVSYSYYVLMQSIIDLLERLQLYSKKQFTEIMTGRRFKGPEKDISERAY